MNEIKMQTINGNMAAASVAYQFTEATAIYPITPSSDMAEYVDIWAAQGIKNLFGNTPRVIDMQSEAGAAGTLHGLLLGGAMASSFTASQGLLLKTPNMYKIAGELLPCVIHVTARTVATHALSIFGDHSDIYGVRSTGFALLNSTSVQEVQDMALVAHLATIEASYPFVHFFDGFRTSHEFNKIIKINPNDMKKLINMKKVQEFKSRSLNSTNPYQMGTAQNPDTYFQNREAANKYIDAVPDIVQNYMDKVSELVGKNYKLYEYTGSATAKYIIIAMGSSCETIEETLERLGKKATDFGLLKVRLYRPFSAKHFTDALPKTVQTITVLDRAKESGAASDPLYADITSTLFEKGINNVQVLAGRYGLASKEFTPDMVATVFDNMKAKKPRHRFTIGINDDVTNTSLEINHYPELVEDGGFMFYGLGSDGTVSANKNSVSIVGDNTDLFAQGYYVFDSKKSGSTTISHVRFSKKPIQSTYLISRPSFVACHNQTFLNKFDMLDGIKKDGVFLLNTTYTPQELESIIPNSLKKILAEQNIKFYFINAYKIAKDIGLGNRINTIMQSAFFKLCQDTIMPYEQAQEFMKVAIKKAYAKKGEKILQMNYDALEHVADNLKEFIVPTSWKSLSSKLDKKPTDNKYYNDYCHTINTLKGNNLPVSVFEPDGRVPTGTTQYEKRNIATSLPKWIHENCIQCNQCVAVCPHATIRPHLLSSEDMESAPENFVTLKANGFADKHFRIQLNQHDCTGCGVCFNACPTKNKALEMVDFSEINETENYEFSKTLAYPNIEPTNIKNSQFLQPLFEFSGACGGCGQTPYIKLVTQLFGDRMIIANATGCSSIYGGSSPVVPYTKNKDGKGPAWANSLLEDNAEFGFGIHIAHNIRRQETKNIINQLLITSQDTETKIVCENYTTTFDSTKENAIATKELVNHLNNIEKTHPEKELIKAILTRQDVLEKKSVWAIGGDGWAYDIGYGGLDHVIANNEDVNILVLDTEVYSNTGGQQSKSTPAGAIAKFAATGKSTNKKNLGMLAMHYDNVYVAQIAIGANMSQALNAIKEAEAHKGPSLIIAYATCIGHGIDMSKSMQIMKEAVDCGYWTLYRRNPTTGLVIDSKPPTTDFQTFLLSQNRYKALEKQDPQNAQNLFDEAKRHSLNLYNKLKRLADIK